MNKIGITGGIGSGKSMVATILKLFGIPVYIADIESKRLTDTSPFIRANLIQLFGENLYTEKGLDRKLLASHIFSHPDKLKQVNAIIHPVINKHYLDWVAKQSTPYCAIESAILFESGFNQIVDTTLLIYAPLEMRIQRATLRDKQPREEIIRRINNQLSDEIKKERSNYVIFNDGKRALLPQITNFLSRL